MPSSSDYYDIDSILAEEELVPCSCLFDFSHLGHLNKDEQDEKYLKEGTKLKMPLWALHKWSSLQYVNLSVPRSWNKKTRETLIADPSGVDLRKRNPHYFLAGAHVANLLSPNDNPESTVVRQFLLQTYMGARLRQTLDWSWSSAHDDDVSGYVVNLTQLETCLFRAGASASAAHAHWILHGSSSQQQQVQKKRKNNRRRAVTPDAEEQEDEKRQRVQ